MRSFILRSIAEQSAEEKRGAKAPSVSDAKKRLSRFLPVSSSGPPVIGEVRCLFGGIAQLGERLPCKQEASGSIPLISTIQHIEN